MVDFVLKNFSELGTLTTASSTYCEPDSEMQTSDTDNQLTRGIQSKSIRDLEREPLLGGVRDKAPTNRGVLG